MHETPHLLRAPPQHLVLGDDALLFVGALALGKFVAAGLLLKHLGLWLLLHLVLGWLNVLLLPIWRQNAVGVNESRVC